MESKCFVQRSIQNIQYINHNGGGCCEYCCKYITKFDLGNRVHVNVKQDRSFVRSKEFLFNEKVTTSHMAQHKNSEKKKTNLPTGRIISINEMAHLMLRYPEVFTDLRFEIIITSP